MTTPQQSSMEDFENITIDLVTAEASYERPDFAKVIFHNIAETYPTDAHIECRYTITSSLVPTSRDWIGLYRVGWGSARDYIYFVWSPIPVNYEEGKEHENSVLFQAHMLPKDDGEFYQFCYVSTSGHVRGASTPFQFRRPGAEDYIEIEDDDADMMIIKSKTVALEDDLKLAIKDKEELQRKIKMLEQERDSLLCKLVETNRTLVSARSQHAEDLEKSKAEFLEQIECLTTEAHDMMLAHDALKEKITFINQEKESILKRLDENDKYISELQTKIKALVSEKDELCGKNKMLEEEKELFKNHFTTSETTVQGYLREVDTLKKQLAEAENTEQSQNQLVAKLQRKLELVANLEKNLEEESVKLQRQESLTKAGQECIEDLQEKLQNTEDKLSTEEHNKALLQDELSAVKQAFEKLSVDLVDISNESHCRKQQVSKMEAHQEEERDSWKKQLKQMDDDLHNMAKEKTRLEELLSQAEHSSQATADQLSSLFALQSAQQHLKERYVKMKTASEEKQQQLDELLRKQRNWQELEQDMIREIQDLKDRLNMGADEYKLKYLECRRLQSELRKAQKQLRKAGSIEREYKEERSVGVGSEKKLERSMGVGTERKVERSMGVGTERRDERSLGIGTERKVERSMGVGTERRDARSLGIETEKVQMADAQTGSNKSVERNTEACAQTEHDQDVQYNSDRELQAQLDSFEELRRELQSKCAKKQKYKQMLQEEREKNALLQRHYHEEINKKDEQLAEKEMEIRTLRCMVEDSREEAVRHMERLQVAPPSASAASSDDDLVTDGSDDASEAGAAAQINTLLSPGGSQTQLAPPLTPLPAPIQPEVLPSAKVAAVKAVSHPVMTGSLLGDDLRNEEDFSENNASTPVIPSAPVDSVTVDIDTEEERFHDAAGDPQKICPVCETPFPADLPMTQFEQHIDSHYSEAEPHGPVCPVCHDHFPVDYPQQQFEEHVNEHLD